MARTKIMIALLLICSWRVWAARPLDTDDAGTVERGKSEAELFFEYCQYRPDGSCQVPGVTVKHGLTDMLDIGLGFSHSTDRDAEGNTLGWGVSPLEVGLKFALLKGKEVWPDISISAGFETGSPEYGMNLILSREHGPWGVHYNLGYDASGEAMVNGSMRTSMAAVYAFSDRVRICGELGGEIMDDGSEVLGNSGLIGGSVTIGPVDWDLGFRIYDQRGPQTTITTGITAGF